MHREGGARGRAVWGQNVLNTQCGGGRCVVMPRVVRVTHHKLGKHVEREDSVA